MPNQRKTIDFICHPDGTVERCIPKETPFQDPFTFSQQNTNQTLKSQPKITTLNENKVSASNNPYLYILPLFLILGIFRAMETQDKSKTNNNIFNRPVLQSEKTFAQNLTEYKYLLLTPSERYALSDILLKIRGALDKTE